VFAVMTLLFLLSAVAVLVHDLLDPVTTRDHAPVTGGAAPQCFLRHPGRLPTHRAIVTEVWGDPDAAAADNLRVQISQLGGASRKTRAIPR
jgi:hypothetical protein